MDSINKKLYDNYEEAGFALLMDEYAQLEGDRLLAEYNNSLNDPAFSPPEGMQERGIKLIRREFRKRSLHTIFTHVYRPVARIATVILALNVFFFISFFTIDAFRAKVLNMVLEFQETHTTVHFLDSDSFGDSTLYSLEKIQQAIPESFSLISQEDYGIEKHYKFVNQEGSTIKWAQYPISSTLNIDTEDADLVENLSISDYEAVVVVKNGITSITWGDTRENLMLNCISDLHQEQLLSIINRLIEHKQQ